MLMMLACVGADTFKSNKEAIPNRPHIGMILI